MIRKLLIFPVFLLVLVSGCISGINVEDMVKADPVVSRFLDEHPNAEIKITLFTREQAQNIIEDVRTDCENPYLDVKAFYRINITDPSTGLYMMVWLDWEERTILCAIKKGTEPECVSHASYKCYLGDLYWYDSCNNREEMKEDCVSGCENISCITINDTGEYTELDVCGDGLCGEEEDCLEDCSFRPSLGMITLECTSAAGGFFNAIIDVGELDDKIAGMTVEEIGEKFVCKGGQTDYGCIVDIPEDDIMVEVGKTGVSGEWHLANTRSTGTLQKQVFGPGSWTLGGARYTNESEHLFMYLHFTKETHPTNKKCWIGDTWLENADENTRNFYKCCYDYDGDEREVRVYIRIPGTNKYICMNKMLHNHRLTLGPSKPEMIEEKMPIAIQVQSIHGYYDEGPAGFRGYVLCFDVEDDAKDGEISVYIDGLKYVHTGEGIGSYYGVCEDESLGIHSTSPWGYSGLHSVKIKVTHNGREGEDVRSIDFSEKKTVTMFTVERLDTNCGTFCTNYTYHIMASGDNLPLGMSYVHEYTPGGDHIRILQSDGKTIYLETYGYCACNTFGTLPVCTGTGGVTCTSQPARFGKIVYDGNIIEEGYCKSIGTGAMLCFDNENSVSVGS